MTQPAAPDRYATLRKRFAHHGLRLVTDASWGFEIYPEHDEAALILAGNRDQVVHWLDGYEYALEHATPMTAPLATIATPDR